MTQHFLCSKYVWAIKLYSNTENSTWVVTVHSTKTASWYCSCVNVACPLKLSDARVFAAIQEHYLCHLGANTWAFMDVAANVQVTPDIEGIQICVKLCMFIHQH